MSADCNAIENDLALFVGGELDPHARAEVAGHLERCETCAAAVGRLAAARAALQAGLEHGDVRVPDLWQGVRARLVESGPIHPPPALASTPKPAANVRWMPRWFPLGAAAAVLIALGLWQMQSAATPVADKGGSTQLAGNTRPAPAQLVGLRRLAPGESALSSTAIPIEQLQEEERLRMSLQQPGGAQAVSQHRGLH